MRSGIKVINLEKSRPKLNDKIGVLLDTLLHVRCEATTQYVQCPSKLRNVSIEISKLLVT